MNKHLFVDNSGCLNLLYDLLILNYKNLLTFQSVSRIINVSYILVLLIQSREADKDNVFCETGIDYKWLSPCFMM